MRIDKLLEYSRKKIPYYQTINTNDLHKFPFTTKKKIKSRYEDFLSIDVKDRELVLEELQRDFSIKNYVIEKKISSDLIMEWTTGSSGVPFKCIKSFSERKQISLVMWKKRMDIDRRLRPTNIYTMIHTGLISNQFDIRNYEKTNIQQLYEDIREGSFSCIHTTPNLLRRHLERSNIEPEFFRNIVPYIEVTGNYLEEEERKEIEDIFQAKILNLYGTIETWGIAYTGIDNLMWTMNDNVILEIIDSDGIPICEPERTGEIVVTALNQYIMPFIRYKTGDIGMYIKFNGPYDKNMIQLCKEREINRVIWEGETKNGEQLVKQLLRKVFWKQNFDDIYNICFVRKGELVEVIMNPIENFEKFEIILREEIKMNPIRKKELAFKYVNEEEYEILNPKGYLYMEKQTMIS